MPRERTHAIHPLRAQVSGSALETKIGERIASDGLNGTFVVMDQTRDSTEDSIDE